MNLQRTTNTNEDFRALVQLLDAHLAVTDEDEHDFYHQYNGLEDIKHVVILYEQNVPLACGAFKHYNPETVEIKRMFTAETARGRGLAVRVLGELEAWAAEEGYQTAILETGIRQPYAIRLYEKQGYLRMTENYGQYAGVENSICMKKNLG
ncbi:GNAT family N-acetyltransferase [Neolewinella aurantiaca]|uniref:GNAT family N-acetyltransferase n=1 Tax=Neolewinella aurantiaca TaxID=2602767 RepID=A0A5C7FFR5_9BACT|nr:GNAT family N-acetyltransferase [Neolewinella aurantiaca]TXF90006.1 GNAT family N-acetyltransferase [Neolewinella aurantiaca]